MTKPAQAEAVPVNNEIVASREPFYVDELSLDTHDIFCFDERGVADAAADAAGITAVTPEEYIRAAGGGLNIVYNLTVVQEAENPFSVTNSFAERTAAMVPVLAKARIRPGVHSDVAAEGGNMVRPTFDGAVGCGYAELRAAINGVIADRGVEIIRDAAELRPELFEGPDDYNFAHAVVSAHERLTERPGFMTNGREVVLTAAGQGSKVMLVKGDHTGTEGIVNLVPGSSLGSDAANRAGLEAYNQDSWAIEEAGERVQHAYPHDKRHLQIAELIDAVGTMRALGVEDIAVRRPQEFHQAA